MDVATAVSLYQKITNDIFSIAYDSKSAIDDVKEFISDIHKASNFFSNYLGIKADDSLNNNLANLTYPDLDFSSIDSSNVPPPSLAGIDAAFSQVEATIKSILASLKIPEIPSVADLSLESSFQLPPYPKLNFEDFSPPFLSSPEITLPEEYSHSFEEKEISLLDGKLPDVKDLFKLVNTIEDKLTEVQNTLANFSILDELEKFSEPIQIIETYGEKFFELMGLFSSEYLDLEPDFSILERLTNLSSSAGRELTDKIFSELNFSTQDLEIFLKKRELFFDSYNRVDPGIGTDIGKVYRNLTLHLAEGTAKKFAIIPDFVKSHLDVTTNKIFNPSIISKANVLMPYIVFILNTMTELYERQYLKEFSALEELEKRVNQLLTFIRTSVNRYSFLVENLKLQVSYISLVLQKEISDVREMTINIQPNKLKLEFENLIHLLNRLNLGLSEANFQYKGLNMETLLSNLGLIRAKVMLNSLKNRFELLKYRNSLLNLSKSRLDAEIQDREKIEYIKNYNSALSLTESYIKYLSNFSNNLLQSPQLDIIKKNISAVESYFRQWMQYIETLGGANGIISKLYDIRLEGTTVQFKTFFEWLRENFASFLNFCDAWFKSNLESQVFKNEARANFFSEKLRSIITQAHTIVSVGNRILEEA